MRKIIFALLPLLVGCTNVQNKGNDSANTGNGQLVTFHLNAPPSNVEPLLLSELADSVSYVALETTKESLTKDGVQYGDRFYSIIDQCLCCFDKNGKYLHQFGRRGQGPDEYIWYGNEYWAFNVDITTNWVYIRVMGGKYLIYDEKGKYLSSRSPDQLHKGTVVMVYDNIAYLYPLDTCYVIDMRTNQVISTMTTNNEILEKSKISLQENYGKPVKGLPGDVLKSYSSKDAYYLQYVYYSDTVFVAQNKEFRPFCLLSAQNKYKFGDEYTDPAKSMVYQPLVLRMQVFKEKLLLCVQYTTAEKECFLDKKENLYWVVCNFNDGSVTYHSYNIVNDLDGGPNILVNEKDINCLSVEDLKNDKEIYNSYFTEGVKAKLKDQEGKFQRLLEPLADDANPIIRTIHWKQ